MIKNKRGLYDSNKFIAEHIGNWYGIRLTEDQVRAVLDSEPELLKDIEEMGLDTSSREWFIQATCRWLNVGPWPTGEDTDSYATAHAFAFSNACKEKAVKLRDGWLEDMSS